MKYLLLALTIALLASCGQTFTPLFRIVENGKTGFIDSTGKVIIHPKFTEAGEFSEGLASARIGGKYGFIDAAGKFVIQPQFDYATEFHDSMALVYGSEGKAFFIDAFGKKLFDANFREVSSFHNGRAIVRSTLGKYGVIDHKGKLFIDTVYEDLQPFRDGMSIAVIKYGTPVREQVIDSLGKTVFPPGKYSNIVSYDNGCFMVYTKDGKLAFVKPDGKVLSSFFVRKNMVYGSKLRCGLLDIRKCEIQKHEYGGHYYTDFYAGFMDKNGKIRIIDTSYRSVSPFSENRAFAETKDGFYHIIDTKGRKIGKHIFDYARDDFKNGVAIVSRYNSQGLVDTNGKFLIAPEYSDLRPLGNDMDYFVSADYVVDKITMIVLSRFGKHISRYRFEAVDPNGFVNGLLQCFLHGKMTYIDRKGKIIWQEKKSDKAAPTPMNIDYMAVADFAVDAMPDPDVPTYYMAFLENPPKPVSKDQDFSLKKLGIWIDTNVKTTISDNHLAYRVFVYNQSKVSQRFGVQVKRLNMVIQALDPKGKWRDIQYLQQSWCGNAYESFQLDPNFYWELKIPVYTGDFKTKLRLALNYFDPNDKSDHPKPMMVYSNTYASSVNPSQFWRTPVYQSSGIMDPFTPMD